MRANPLTAQSALLFPFPLGGANAQAGFRVEGQPDGTRSEQTTAELNMVSAGAPPVAIVNQASLGEFGGRNPIGGVRTIEQILSESTGQARFRSFLIVSFAALALLLAAVSVYGLISFTVAQRVPEIGVRLALGANPWQVFRLVIGPGLRLAVVGVVGVAVAATRLVSGLLFNTSTTDPVIYASLSLLLLTMAALACYVPARRAMRVDPMTASRSE